MRELVYPTNKQSLANPPLEAQPMFRQLTFQDNIVRRVSLSNQ
jgi:hypothetical protein